MSNIASRLAQFKKIVKKIFCSLIWKVLNQLCFLTKHQVLKKASKNYLFPFGN